MDKTNSFCLMIELNGITCTKKFPILHALPRGHNCISIARENSRPGAKKDGCFRRLVTLLYGELSNRPQVPMGYKLINNAGCW